MSPPLRMLLSSSAARTGAVSAAVTTRAVKRILMTFSIAMFRPPLASEFNAQRKVEVAKGSKFDAETGHRCKIDAKEPVPGAIAGAARESLSMLPWNKAPGGDALHARAYRLAHQICKRRQ